LVRSDAGFGGLLDGGEAITIILASGFGRGALMSWS
jgi:hypothetical protein